MCINKKNLILETVSDLATMFLYYDRKEDDDLSMGVIEQSIINGDITVDEIVNRFKTNIEKSVVRSGL